MNKDLVDITEQDLIAALRSPDTSPEQSIIYAKMCFAPRKYEIKEAIAELRLTKQLPSKNADYKPNYDGIKSVYAISIARLLKLENEKKRMTLILMSLPASIMIT